MCLGEVMKSVCVHITPALKYRSFCRQEPNIFKLSRLEKLRYLTAGVIANRWECRYE